MKSDLEGNLAKPKSAIGMIVAALRQRREQGTRSFTVLSCDNLPENGDKVNKHTQHNQHNQHKCHCSQCTEGLYVCIIVGYQVGCNVECYISWFEGISV